MPDFCCGLDLGQVRDYSALAVVSYDKEYLAARERRAEIEEHYERLARGRGRESAGQLSFALRSERGRTLEEKTRYPRRAT